MAPPFSFVRNVFGRGDKSQPPKLMPAQGDRIEVVEPGALSITAAQEGFYRVLFDLPDTVDVSGDVALSVPQKLVVDVVRGSLTEKEFRAKAVPRLPSVIPKLLRSLRDPDASAKDYVNIINKDPAMSAAVLKLANSVYFNPTCNRINSIDIAVVKLGIEGLRAVLSAAVMQPVVQRQSAYFSQLGRKLWEHTLACAVACEIVATQRGLEPYKAYLLGLTHEVGKITLFSELSKQFQKNGGDKPAIGAFIPLMWERSNSMSATIAMDWDLPKEIVAALQQQIDLVAGRQVGPYGHLLFQSNLACEAYAMQRYGKNESFALETLAEQLCLPAHIFTDLDHLSIEV